MVSLPRLPGAEETSGLALHPQALYNGAIVPWTAEWTSIGRKRLASSAICPIL
jgi:hypothetical protein